MKKGTFFTPCPALKRGERLDKRKHEDLRHTCFISPAGRRYEFMGTLDAEEARQLHQQTGLEKTGKVELGRGSFGRVRLVRAEDGTYLVIKKMKKGYGGPQSKFNIREIAELESHLIEQLQGIDGIIFPVETFLVNDKAGHEVIVSIMPLADLGDAEELTECLYKPGRAGCPLPHSLQIELLNCDYQANPVTSSKTAVVGFNRTSPDVDLITEYELPENLIKLLSESRPTSLPVNPHAEDAWIERGCQSEIRLTPHQNLHLKMSNLLLIYIARELTSTLSALHKRGIYHRDVQLKNVLLTREAEVLLTDFGCAIHYGFQDCYKSSVLSKPLAPELFQKDTDLGHLNASRSIDAWRLGMLLSAFLEGSQTLDYVLRSAYPGNVIYWGGELHFPNDLSSFLDVLHQRIRQELQNLFVNNNVPLQMRKIIAGLLNPYPENRLGIAEVIPLLNELPTIEKAMIRDLLNELKVSERRASSEMNTQPVPPEPFDGDAHGLEHHSSFNV
ncbi:serine/threonine-protein kinase [Legionella rubrilucens]|uniref:Serine/threonine-protein kinase n=1 Tax=Legionella rubrilucens TaxID=458 RepID=A0A0W0XWS0_9GAMM|nr:protein kinase [Legionella rubrilucens]KTD48659.1 serine/threonine-protein kinase [Legionella rubrilucens]